MNRRSFLQSILVAGVAPAFIGSSVLMPVRKIWEPKYTYSFLEIDVRIHSWPAATVAVGASEDEWAFTEVARVMRLPTHILLGSERELDESLRTRIVGSVVNSEIRHVPSR